MVEKKHKWVCDQQGCGFLAEAHAMPVLAMLVQSHQTMHKINKYNQMCEDERREKPGTRTIVKRESEPLTAFDLAFLKDIAVQAW